jgi:hypothetical protein
MFFENMLIMRTGITEITIIDNGIKFFSTMGLLLLEITFKNSITKMITNTMIAVGLIVYPKKPKNPIENHLPKLNLCDFLVIYK